MSLLMLLIAQTYAPLAARGALVEGWSLRPLFRTDVVRLRARTTRSLVA